MSATDVIASERLEALLAGAAGTNERERRLEGLLGELHASPALAPERLRARVARVDVPARSRLAELWACVSPRRALLIAAAAGAALLLGAATVQGLLTSAPGHTTAARSLISRASRGAARGSAGLPVWAGSPDSGNGAAGAPLSQAPSTLRALGAPPPSPSRLTDYQASLRIRVNDQQALTRQTTAAVRLARALGGYVASVDYRTPAGQPGESDIALRLPVNRVVDALAQLSGLGTVISQHVTVVDLQHVLESQNAQIASLGRLIVRLEQALRQPGLPLDVRVRLQYQLGEAKFAQEQRTHARGSTVADGSLARVALVLTTKHVLAATVHHAGRFERALRGALSFLAAAGAIALYLLIIASPLVVLAAVGLQINRARRRRDERRLLAA